MNKQQLLQQLQDIEWDNFEVKTAQIDIPKDAWETVSAFANTSGGWLVLLNLLIHTDYFSPMKPRIRVFTNRIEFENTSSLPRPVEELLKADESLPRNPVLAKFFRIARLCFIMSKELSNIIGITPDNILVNIAKLKNKGIIRREGADKGGKWIIINKETDFL